MFIILSVLVCFLFCLSSKWNSASEKSNWLFRNTESCAWFTCQWLWLMNPIVFLYLFCIFECIHFFPTFFFSVFLKNAFFDWGSSIWIHGEHNSIYLVCILTMVQGKIYRYQHRSKVEQFKRMWIVKQVDVPGWCSWD